MSFQRCRNLAGVLILIFGLPALASAQATNVASITGVVRDGTGAVLPGVTVEASSPVLIEKVRTVVSDGQGQYRIVDLRPGTYTVTFVLPGFSTVKREGIELTGGFTATFNAQMQVGALEETITVTGQTPLIDTQSVTETRAISNQIIDALPTGRLWQTVSVIVPGVNMSLGNHDVGGAAGEGNGYKTLSVNASRTEQMPLIFNGMRFNNMNGTGGGPAGGMLMVTGSIEELTVTTTGIGAEWGTSGVATNSIPKEGGNTWRATLFANFANTSMQNSNLTDELRRQGITELNRIRKLWDVNPGVGGPLKQDKLWFYAGYRHYGAQNYFVGAYPNLRPDSPQYCGRVGGCVYNGVRVPDSRDLSEQAWGGDAWNSAWTLNLTWQASDKDKLTFFGTQTFREHPCIGCGPGRSPEASRVFTPYPEYMVQTTWTKPYTNRLLLEAGMTFYNETFHHVMKGYGRIHGSGPDAQIAKLETSTGTWYGATESYNHNSNHLYNGRVSASYVTGSHAFKVGATPMWGTRGPYQLGQNQAQSWTLTNGVPVSISQSARPYDEYEKLKLGLGVYAQDKWTVRNVTLNMGLRFEYLNSYVPAQSLPATLFVPAREYPKIENVPVWKDLSPRLGVAWDVFGSGRTVTRFNYSKFVANETAATAIQNNPLNAAVNNVTRRWTDTDGDFFPDCDLRSRLANGECGAMSAPLGDLNIVTRYDPEILEGWGVRPGDHEITAGIEQQLMRGVALDVTYARHWYSNFFATQNRATPPSVFSTYCVTAPSDPRLPNGGGNQICGFADINPAGFGLRPDNFVTKASNFGDISDVYTGVSANVTARFLRGAFLSTGFSLGREVTDQCDIIGQANQGGPPAQSTAGGFSRQQWGLYPSSIYCRVEPPYQADIKLSTVYPLPWDLQVAAVVINRPGPEIRATHVITAANLSTTTLTRAPLAGSAVVDLIPPMTEFADRLNQIDLRFSRLFRMGDNRISASLDVYNLMNINTSLGLVDRFGPTWLRPTSVVTGRFLKIGGQIDF